MGRKIKQRAAVGTLGKFLTRRSRGKCELCGSKNTVRAHELIPFPTDPDPERTLMGCERCRSWLEGQRINPLEARFLGEAVWSEEPAIKLAAARMLLRLDDIEDPWMKEAFDWANVDPATGEFRA